MNAFVRNFVATSLHKFWVMYYIVKLCLSLLKRGIVHDLSKFGKYEEPYFRAQLDKLRYTTYGTPEYKALLELIKPALEHHYKVNSHHPEFYQNGIRGMDILDELEMLADWKAATLRHHDGCIKKSIVANSNRFGYDEKKIQKYLRVVEEAGL